MSYIILVLNILIHVFVITKGVNGTTPASLDLIEWGGNLSSLTLYGDEWRLLTSIFLHGGWLHLALNMVMLWQLGPLAEKQFGRIPFLVIYFLTGLFASLTSAIWYQFNLVDLNHSIRISVSIGASGALMGMSAACAAHSFLRTKFFAHDDNAELIHWSALARVVALNIAIGFMITGVDNASHIGGAISGLVIGLLFSTSKKISFIKTILISIVSIGFIQLVISNIKFNEEIELASKAIQQEIQKENAIKMRKLENEQFAKISLQEKIDRPAAKDEPEAAGTIIQIDGIVEDFVLSKDEAFAYITDNQKNRLSLVNLKTGKISFIVQGAKLPLGGCYDNKCAGQGAAGVAVSNDQTWALVSSLQRNSVSIVDLKSKTIKNSIPVENFPRNVLLSADQKTAFIFSSLDNVVSVLDIGSEKIINTISLQGGPADGQSYGRVLDMALSERNQKLYVLNSIKNLVEIYDIASGKISTSISVSTGGEFDDNIGTYKLALANEDTKLFVLSSRGISRFDLKTNSLERNFPFCLPQQFIFDFSIDSAGKKILISESNSQRARGVSLLSYTTNRVFPITGHLKKSMFLQNSQKFLALTTANDSSELSILDWDSSLPVEEPNEDQPEMFCP